MESLSCDHTASDGHCGVLGMALQNGEAPISGMAGLRMWRKRSQKTKPCMVGESELIWKVFKPWGDVELLNGGNRFEKAERSSIIIRDGDFPSRQSYVKTGRTLRRRGRLVFWA